jgi:hypothetical protein
MTREGFLTFLGDISPTKTNDMSLVYLEFSYHSGGWKIKEEVVLPKNLFL